MNIKELRTLTGMTQQAFAEYFSIPKRNIENWEEKKSNCPLYLLNLIEYKLKKENLI
ncbi:MAG: transcriptional regulator [Ruminococcaceae bacterium]|nr:transcriptional regulator [Oscillospiraceae bacterium]